MPKVRPLIQDSDRENKEKLLRWLRYGMARRGINKRELARRTGISETRLHRRFAEPEKMEAAEMWAIERVIGTEEEVFEEVRACR